MPFGLPAERTLIGRDIVDAARDDGFTGEVVIETQPVVRIYLDRGRVYLAERRSDARLGERLVAAGAIDATQLQQGSIHVGGAEYLGRLFARDNGVDRAAVMCATESMNDECLGWLAQQPVDGFVATPYRRHPSSLHRWDEPTDDEIAAMPVGPPMPLPPPPATAQPVSQAPPDALIGVIRAAGAAAEEISWDEPSWLDERPAGGHGRIAALPTATEHEVGSSAPSSARRLGISSNWFEGLGVDLSPCADAPTPTPAPAELDEGGRPSLTLVSHEGRSDDVVAPVAPTGAAGAAGTDPAGTDPAGLGAPGGFVAPAIAADGNSTPTSEHVTARPASAELAVPATAADPVEHEAGFAGAAIDGLTPPTEIAAWRDRASGADGACDETHDDTHGDTVETHDDTVDTARTAALRRLVGGLRNT